MLVGSRAHGLENLDSDYDYRGVYVLPTKEILSLGYNYKGSHWLEGEKEDQTSWEIGHFLLLATKCNPTILEVFKAPLANNTSGSPISAETDYQSFSGFGRELRELFPYLWNPQDAFNAFTGYGLNQRKKMLDNHLGRWEKYAVAYLRTLYNLNHLLVSYDFALFVPQGSFKELLLRVKSSQISSGEVIDIAQKLENQAKTALASCSQKQDLEKVNDFLLKVRKEFWDA